MCVCVHVSVCVWGGVPRGWSQKGTLPQSHPLPTELCRVERLQSDTQRPATVSHYRGCQTTEVVTLLRLSDYRGCQITEVARLQSICLMVSVPHRMVGIENVRLQRRRTAEVHCILMRHLVFLTAPRKPQGQEGNIFMQIK